jgi:hypothetical protein
VVCALTLAGCGGSSSGAAVLPTRDTPTAAVPSPTPSLTTAQIAAEAVAFVKGYYAEINHAIATGDTTKLRAMQTDTCVCLRLTKGISDTWRSAIVREREVFRTSGYKPHDVYPAVASVTVPINGRGYTVFERDGRIRDRVPPKRVIEDVEIVRKGDAWLVSDVRQLPE